MMDCIKLKSGREIYANNGIVGIDAGLELYEGYDGGIDLDDCPSPLSHEEKLEFADIMIDRWMRFKAALEEGKDT